jgi:hypothetical protein
MRKATWRQRRIALQLRMIVEVFIIQHKPVDLPRQQLRILSHFWLALKSRLVR